MESEVYDRLNIKQNNEIIIATKIDPDEILYSDIIIKINKRGRRQERILLITKKALFNIIPAESMSLASTLTKFFSKILKIKFSRIKRIISLNNIEVITLSSHYLSSEFILHVIGERNYRYDGRYGFEDKRDKAILTIAKGLKLLQKNLQIILVNEICLVNKPTSKDKSQICRPIAKTIEVTPNDLFSGVQFIVQKQNKGLSLLDLSMSQSFCSPQESIEKSL